jgi:hypothetical protein
MSADNFSGDLDDVNSKIIRDKKVSLLNKERSV